jgi:hypothetical protein
VNAVDLDIATISTDEGAKSIKRCMDPKDLALMIHETIFKCLHSELAKYEVRGPAGIKLVGRSRSRRPQSATPCVSWMLIPFRQVRYGSISPVIKGLSFTSVRDGSPRFIGVAEVVTEAKKPAQRLLHRCFKPMKQRFWLVTRFSGRSTWESVPSAVTGRGYTFIQVRIRGAWVDARSIDHPVTNRANDAATALCCNIHCKLSIICDRNLRRSGRLLI